MKQTKNTTSQVEDLLLALLPYLLGGLVWIGAGCLMLQATKTDLQQQINDIWEEAIQLDCHNRLEQTGARLIQQHNNEIPATSITTVEIDGIKKHFDRDTLPVPTDGIDRAHRAIQTLLLLKSPINPVHLDSLFNALLNKKNISAQTAVVYLHKAPNNLPLYSVQDTTFCTRAFATKEVKTSIENSIVLRGFVKLSAINYIQYDWVFYLLWACCAVLFIIGVYYFQLKLSKKHLSPESLILAEPATIEPAEQPTIISYHTFTHILRYGELTLSFTPLESCLLECLMEKEDYQQDYEVIIKQLWPKNNGDRKKLEQQRRHLQTKLNQTSVLSIDVIRGIGYHLQISKNVTFVREESGK